MTKKLTYEFVKEQIEKEEYKLLSTEYKSAHKYLEIQCNKKHIYKVKWNDWQQGRRCPKCCKYTSGLTYSYIKEQIENVEGYKLLSQNYVNAFNKLKIKCDKGHIYKVKWNNFDSGQRCPYCAGKAKHTYQFVKKQIESVNGYKLLSKNYVSALNKLKIKCDKGHIYKVIYNSFQQGHRCPICDYTKTTSKAEKEILKIIKSLTNKKVIENDRTQIINSLTGHNLELDMWIPLLNKAVEYNGDYWHSSDYAKFKDNEKIKQCKEKNINLLVINEQNWTNNKNNEINKIIKFIGY